MKDFKSFIHEYRGAIVRRNNSNINNLHRASKISNWNTYILYTEYSLEIMYNKINMK